MNPEISTIFIGFFGLISHGEVQIAAWKFTKPVEFNAKLAHKLDFSIYLGENTAKATFKN